MPFGAIFGSLFLILLAAWLTASAEQAPLLPRLCLAPRLLQLLILTGSRGVSPCSLHGTFMLVLVHVLLLAFALPHLDSFPH